MNFLKICVLNIIKNSYIINTLKVVCLVGLAATPSLLLYQRTIANQNKHVDEDLTSSVMVCASNGYYESIKSSAPTLKIFFVHSYSDDNPCTGPEREGMRDKLYQLSGRYNLMYREIYMNTRLYSRSKQDIQNLADILIPKIINFNPDYILTTDDDAFEYVGIPLSYKYKVIGCGINKSVDDYKNNFKNYNKDNISVILEDLLLTPLLNIFNRSLFKPDAWYILWDKSVTSYYLMKRYEQELKGNTIKAIQIDTIQDLRRALQELNKQSKGVLVITIQTLYNSDLNGGKGGYVDKFNFFNEFLVFNNKHLELTSNIEFPRYGYSFSCGPNFYKMGELAGAIIIDSINMNKYSPKYLKSDIRISINLKRLQELGYSDLARDGFSLIDKVYNNY